MRCEHDLPILACNVCYEAAVVDYRAYHTDRATKEAAEASLVKRHHQNCNFRNHGIGNKGPWRGVCNCADLIKNQQKCASMPIFVYAHCSPKCPYLVESGFTMSGRTCKQYGDLDHTSRGLLRDECCLEHYPQSGDPETKEQTQLEADKRCIITRINQVTTKAELSTALVALARLRP